MNCFLTATEVLKCGFSYIYYPSDKIFHRKITGIEKYSVANNMLFVKNIWVYDVELDGEINVQYELFKTKRKKWILINRQEIKELFAVQPLIEEINLSYNPNLNFIYIIKSDLGYKIGKTKKIENRYKIFNVKMPFNWIFTKIFAVPQRDVSKIEKFLHERFQKEKINGEWFQLNEQNIHLIEQFIQQINYR